MNTLSERIKLAMSAANLSQADLVRATGASGPSVFNWINGRTKNLKGRNLVLAARALGVSDSWLADGRGQMERAEESFWPFDSVPWERFQQLTEAQQKGIEDALRRQVDAFLGEAPVKSEGDEKAA